jgi:hypothetical protein
MRANRIPKRLTSEVALLLGQPDFPDCYLGKRHGIGNAALVNVDHSLSGDLANRIVTIHQVRFPDGAIERQFENVPLLWRKIALTSPVVGCGRMC